MTTTIKTIVCFFFVTLSVSVQSQTKKAVTNSKPATTKVSSAKTPTTKPAASVQEEPKVSPAPAASTSSPLGLLSGLGKKNGTGTIPQSSFRKGSKYFGGSFNFGSSTSTSIALFGEYGVTDYLSVGGSASVANSSVYRTMYLGGDVTLHLCNLIKSGAIDPFVGVSGGYGTFKDKAADEVLRDKSRDPSQGLRLMGNAGVNYYVSPKVIVFVNASIGIVNGSPLQYGGGIKFGL